MESAFFILSPHQTSITYQAFAHLHICTSAYLHIRTSINSIPAAYISHRQIQVQRCCGLYPGAAGDGADPF